MSVRGYHRVSSPAMRALPAHILKVAKAGRPARLFLPQGRRYPSRTSYRLALSALPLDGVYKKWPLGPIHERRSILLTGTTSTAAVDVPIAGIDGPTPGLTSFPASVSGAADIPLTPSGQVAWRPRQLRGDAGCRRPPCPGGESELAFVDALTAARRRRRRRRRARCHRALR